jgi:hypothetical protein
VVFSGQNGRMRTVGFDKDGRFTYIDQAGAVVIDASRCGFREFFSCFSEGLAAVAVDDSSGNVKCGFVDRTGKLIVQAQ